MATNPQNQEYHSPWSDVGIPKEMPKKPFRPSPPAGSGFIKWAIWIILLLVLVGVGIGAYSFIQGIPEGSTLGLEFSQPDEILIGQPFTVTLSFSNYSDSVLKDAKLSLFLPNDISFLGQFADQRVVEQALGDLGPGSLNQEKFNLIVTAGSQTLKHLEAKLAYALATNPKAQFESRAEVDLRVSQPAVGLTLTAPGSVFNGEEFEITLHYENNTNQEFRNVRVRMDYPPIFRFVKSNITPDGTGNNLWTFTTLKAGERGDITIRGSALGPEQSFFSMTGELTSDFLGQTYTVSSQTASVNISQAPLSVRATVNGAGPDYVARVADLLQYTISYRNNSNVTFQDLTVKARLTGELYDFATIQANAPFNSLTNTLSWFVANTPELASLAPGEERSVAFTVKLRESFPIRRISDKNYLLKVQAEVDSPTLPPGTAADRTVSIASLENKVVGAITVDAQGYWRDAGSGFLNSGPYPPKVNRPTQYTIHWLVTNYATDVTNVQVSAYLQSGARFTGKAKTTAGAQPAINPNSGLVTWRIDSLPATKGVVSAPAEAIFQIEVTPGVNLVGKSVSLLSETRLEAQDVFTGMPLTAADGVLTSDLPDDKTLPESGKGVQP